MPGEPPAKAPGKPGVPAETPSTAGIKPSGPVSPKAGAEPPPPPGKPIEESPLPVYWLKGKTGELVPVPGFSLEDFEALMSQKYRPEQAEKVPRYSLQARKSVV